MIFLVWWLISPNSALCSAVMGLCVFVCLLWLFCSLFFCSCAYTDPLMGPLIFFLWYYYFPIHLTSAFVPVLPSIFCDLSPANSLLFFKSQLRGCHFRTISLPWEPLPFLYLYHAFFFFIELTTNRSCSLADQCLFYLECVTEEQGPCLLWVPLHSWYKHLPHHRFLGIFPQQTNRRKDEWTCFCEPLASFHRGAFQCLWNKGTQVQQIRFPCQELKVHYHQLSTISHLNLRRAHIIVMISCGGEPYFSFLNTGTTETGLVGFSEGIVTMWTWLCDSCLLQSLTLAWVLTSQSQDTVLTSLLSLPPPLLTWKPWGEWLWLRQLWSVAQRPMVGIPWMLLERMILNMIWVMQTVLLAYFPLHWQWSKKSLWPHENLWSLEDIFIIATTLSSLPFPQFLSSSLSLMPSFLTPFFPPSLLWQDSIIYHCSVNVRINMKTQEDEDDRAWKEKLLGRKQWCSSVFLSGEEVDEGLTMLMVTQWKHSQE